MKDRAPPGRGICLPRKDFTGISKEGRDGRMTVATYPRGDLRVSRTPKPPIPTVLPPS